MFKVKKIEEKISLEDLKVNDDNPCYQMWVDHGKADQCMIDCCRDCTDSFWGPTPFKIKEY